MIQSPALERLNRSYSHYAYTVIDGVSARHKHAAPGQCAFEQQWDLVGRQRQTEEKTLRLVTTQTAQGIELHGGLHSLGCDLEHEGTTERADCLGNRHIVPIRRKILHERVVYLDPIDGQVLQHTEGGITGSEIIDRDLDPEVLKSVECLVDVFDPEKAAFGDLDFEPRGWKSAFVERRAHILVEALMGEELTARDVDSQAKIRPEPGSRFTASPRQHPATERLDKAGLFGDRDEVEGGDHPFARIRASAATPPPRSALPSERDICG